MVKFLILVVAILAIITIWQIVRIAELVSQLNPDKGDEVVKKKDNKTNAVLMLLFLIGELIFMVYQIMRYKRFFLPESASVHGVETDNLLNINFLIIGLVFLATQVLLFWYAYKYSFKKENKATFYPDNHKLEIIWTIIPTIVLVVIIVYGLKAWNTITEPAPNNSLKVELYAKQFDWTACYAGKDNELGRSNYRLISDENALGLDTSDATTHDNIVVKELHLPVGRSVAFDFHSRDVIHSAYMPHFRAQMNCVPGMITKFHFVTKYTTEQMRQITKNEKFDYVLLCNKICGVAHFNMKMKIVVESEAQFNEWLASQKAFKMAAVVEPAKPAADSLKVASL